MTQLILSLTALFFLTNCSQFQRTDTMDESAQISEEEGIPTEISDQAVQSLRKMIDSMAEMIDKNEEPSDEVEQYKVKMVRIWIDYFTKRDRERFQRYLDRGQKYKEVVQTTLEENGLPNELFYLALIESGYATHAYSHASAVGVWQFIKATGERYGLKSNHYVDERRDPIMATEGAAKYLRDLYNAFLSWELAMSGYNAGELRVLRAIMDGKTRDFWVMSMQNRLPKETRNYVPKFIAAAMIGTNLEKYGFRNPAENAVPYPSVVAVEVPPRVRLADIAAAADVDLKALQEVNPHIRRGVTPPTRGSTEIWVPEEHVAKIQGIQTSLTAKQVAMSGIEDTASTHYHTVRKGDNLSQIAQQYRMSIRTLQNINDLSSSRIYPGMKLRISAKSYKRPPTGGSTYIVRSGDNLGLIARRYNMSIHQLKEINRLSSDQIRVGQTLIISGMPVAGPKNASASRYTVRRGDTLEKIAHRFGLSINELKNLNGLKRNVIYAGETLTVGSNRETSSVN